MPWCDLEQDRLLHVLPLHHLHGLLNKLMCVLWAGGTVEFAHDTRYHTTTIEDCISSITCFCLWTIFRPHPPMS